MKYFLLLLFGIFHTNICFTPIYNKIKLRIPKCTEKPEYIIPPPLQQSQPSQPSEPPQPFFGIPGMFVGIPLNILTYIYTSHHYHENILNPKLIVLQTLIGLYTYGNDKYNDAMEYEKKVLTNTTITSVINNEKVKMYEYVIKHKQVLKEIYNNSYYILLLLLFEDNGISFHSLFFLTLYRLFTYSQSLDYTFFSYYLGITPGRMRMFYILIITYLFQTQKFVHEFTLFPFLLFLDSTNNYIDIKRNNKIIKPFYVSFMWITAFLIMPCVIYENNYNILQYPIDYLSPFLLIFGLSNYVDIKDVEEDRLNKIQTIPVLYGKDLSLIISYTSFFTSFLLYL